MLGKPILIHLYDVSPTDGCSTMSYHTCGHAKQPGFGVAISGLRVEKSVLAMQTAVLALNLATLGCHRIQPCSPAKQGLKKHQPHHQSSSDRDLKHAYLCNHTEPEAVLVFIDLDTPCLAAQPAACRDGSQAHQKYYKSNPDTVSYGSLQMKQQHMTGWSGQNCLVSRVSSVRNSVMLCAKCKKQASTGTPNVHIRQEWVVLARSVRGQVSFCLQQGLIWFE